MSINNNLRKLRIACGMTQEQAAEKLGVTRQALSSYELGRTRPDIDMLIRLAELYRTDLDSILYGKNPAQKAARRIKTAALILLALLVGLNFISSALLWCANFFFPVSDGQLTQEKRLLFRLTDAWEMTGGLTLAVSLIGFALLLLFILTAKYKIPLKHKLIYIAVLSGGTLFVTLPFALTDSVFAPIDYLFTPIRMIGRMLFFFAINLIIEFVQRKHHKPTDSAN